MGYTKQSQTGEVNHGATVKRVLWLVLALNLLVAVLKLVWGTISGSVAMQADGFHSLFDGTSNVIGLVGIAVASRPADRSHPYGHRKYETYASAVIGAMLLFAAFEVGHSAYQKILSGTTTPAPGLVSFGVMLGTLAMNLGVTTWEHRVGRRTGSEILIADASHTRSDILVSLGVIAGLIAVRMGFPLADPIIAFAVAGAIVHTAFGVWRQADQTLSDRARIDSVEVCTVAREVEGVQGCHSIRTRGATSEVYVDMHVQVDAALSVGEGHAIAESVERRVAEYFAEVCDVIVHVEPQDDYQRQKTADEAGRGLV